MEYIALTFSMISLAISILGYYKKHKTIIEPKTISRKRGAILFKTKTPEQQRRAKLIRQSQQNNKDININDLW